MLASWITLRLIPWLKARTDAQQQDYLLSTAKILVYAAEQLYGAGRGADKLNYVERELAIRGLKIDTAAIEAAVREMNLLESWEAIVEVEDDEDLDDYDEYEDADECDEQEDETDGDEG